MSRLTFATILAKNYIIFVINQRTDKNKVMAKIDGYLDIVPKIKKIKFPVRGKIGIMLNDGREIIAPISAFPSIKKVPVKVRNKWYLTAGGFTWDSCPEVIHIEQVLGNFSKYKHEE